MRPRPRPEVHLSSENDVVIMTDASFDPDTKAYGWAVWIQYGRAPATIVKTHGRGRNKEISGSTYAEKRALWKAIYFMVGEKVPFQGKTINIHSDCTCALRSKDIKHDLVNYLLHCKAKDVILNHVRGHNGDGDPLSIVNNWCHRQAYMEMRRLRTRLREKQRCQ